MSVLTPEHVCKAVAIPTFFEKHDEFWKMLCYLFTSHNGQKVWEQLPLDTVRTIMEQLHMVIESTESYSTISSNQGLLYHVFFALLRRVKGGRSVSQFMAYEKYSVLTGFHHVYKQLYHMNVVMPLFGHMADDLDF